MGIEVIGLAIMAASAVSQYTSAQDAKAAASASAAEQRQQVAAQQRIADIKNARERAQQVQAARIAQANILSRGANTGTMTSSGVIGGMSSVGTQSASNLGDFGAIQEQQSDIFASQSRQAGFTNDMTSAQSDMAFAGAAFTLGTTIFNAAGGFKGKG